jgi:hypothetical protein
MKVLAIKEDKEVEDEEEVLPTRRPGSSIKEDE